MGRTRALIASVVTVTSILATRCSASSATAPPTAAARSLAVHVRANHLEDASGATMTLRGVDISGPNKDPWRCWRDGCTVTQLDPGIMTEVVASAAEGDRTILVSTPRSTRPPRHRPSSRSPG